jgi:serine/threonine protein kinase
LSEDFSAYLGKFRPGSVLSGYTLEALVAEGGMAWVFRARHLRLDRLVALKVLKPALASDRAYQRRFVAEARAASAVDDPHIIPVYEADEADGVLFIAMRFIPGGDLSRLAEREGPMPSARATDFISPVASALDAAHGAGLVHRDVKPANILVDARPGRPDHVYLSDFGVSKAAMSTLNLTGVGDFIGTASYSAPEQFEGKGVDGRTDQYALACVTYQLLTGTVPFKRDTFMSVMMAHVTTPPPSLVAQRPDLPEAADRVLARALAKAAADRYETCGDFAEALREALGLTPYNARNSATSPPPPRFLPTASPSEGHLQTAIVNEPTPPSADPTPPPANRVPAPANPHNTMTMSTPPDVTELPAAATEVEVEAEADQASPASDADADHPDADHPDTAVEHLDTPTAIPTPEATAAAAPVETTDVTPAPADTVIAERPEAMAEASANTVIADPPPDVTAQLPAAALITEVPDTAANESATTDPLPQMAAAAAVDQRESSGSDAGGGPATPVLVGPRPDGGKPTGGAIVWIRRHRLPSVALGCVIAAAAGLIPFALISGARSPNPTDPTKSTTALSPSNRASSSSRPSPTARASSPRYTGVGIDLPAADRGGQLSSLAFSPSGAALAIADGAGICLWDIATHRCTVKFPIAHSVVFSPDGTTVAAVGGSAADRGTVRLWDVATGKRTATLVDPDSQGAYSAAYNPDGSMLAVGDGNGNTYLWDVFFNKTTTAIISLSHSSFDAVTFSPNGTTLAVGDTGGSAYLVNTGTKKVIFPVTVKHPTPPGVDSLAFSSDGSTLAIGDANGYAYLVNIATRKVTAELTDPGSKGVNAVAFSPGGSTLAVGDANGSTYLVDIAAKAAVATLTDPGSKGVTSVAFGGDGKTLATGDTNGSAYLWYGSFD